MVSNTHHIRINEVIELSLSHYLYFKTITGSFRATDNDLDIIAVVTWVERIGISVIMLRKNIMLPVILQNPLPEVYRRSNYAS